MTGLSVPTSKQLVLLSGRAHPELAAEVAEQLGISLSVTSAYDFANGEIFVRFEESVRGCDVFVLQSHTTPINTWIMEQLIMVDALKRASAKRINLIIPFYVTPVRTRSTEDVSPSRLGFSPICSRRQARAGS